MTLPDLTDRHLRLGIAGGALIFLVSSVGAALLGGASGAGVLVAGLALCLVFLFLSRFKRFKGFGLEAETWEEKMHEAGRVIARLDHLAITMAEITYRQLSSTGRWGRSLHAEELQRYVDQLDNTLLDAGIERARIEQLKEPIHCVNMTDIFYSAQTPVRKYIEEIKKVRMEPMKKSEGALGHEAQKVQREAMSRCQDLDELMSAVKSACFESPFGKAADRIEAVIKSNAELSGDEKIRLLDLFGRQLDLMRQYSAHNRWPAGVSIAVE